MKKYFFVIILIAALTSVFCAVSSAADITEGQDILTDAEAEGSEQVSEETETEEPDVLDAYVYIKGDSFIKSEEFTVSLIVKGTSLRGSLIKLSYDKSMLAPVSVTHSDAEGFTVYHSVSDGRMTFVFYNDASYTGEFGAADVTFRITDGKEHDIIEINIDKATVSDGENEKDVLAKKHALMLLSDIHTDFSDTDINTVTETEEIPVTETETEVDIRTETETESDTQTKDQTETDTETETETETGTDEVSETVTGTVTETETGEDSVTDSQTTDGKKHTPGISGMPVIITVIAAAVSGAAVGAVFIIRNAVKKKTK